MLKLILTAALTVSVLFSYAHGDGDPKKKAEEYGAKYLNWHHADPKADNIMGISTNKAYEELLKGKKPAKKIIVAVIDGGVDPHHEDLKNVMWINKGEIADNGIDDDNNGYVDDIYGWNFLGNSKGENVNDENLEYTRIYRTLKPKYEGKSEEDIAQADKEEYALYLEVKDLINVNTAKRRAQLNQYTQMLSVYSAAHDVVAHELGKDSFTVQEVDAYETDDKEVQEMFTLIAAFMKQGVEKSSLEGGVEYLGAMVNYYLNPDFNGRADIIGDDPSDINSMKGYGNPNVKGPDAGHGTFVAGLIAASRGNNIGIDGVANNVEIMAVRAIPNGDEYDKDVALAIRYAVDNGANVINMSFGKQYSPYKSMVDDAIKYAEDKGVLLINAAGNDHTNVDEKTHFPIDRLNSGHTCTNMITVGASSMLDTDEFTGSFTNYGKESVDIFAPGVDMVSCAPDSFYDKGNGTSYASPVVAGVAALVWSYYPSLTAVELKEVLMSSAVNLKKMKVRQPGVEEKNKNGEMEPKIVKLKEICVSGGLVSVYNALKAAEKAAK